ncbi:MAG: histidine kinase dimerization/phosphoacceptor domain -containing protein [Thainema sp.]
MLLVNPDCSLSVLNAQLYQAGTTYAVVVDAQQQCLGLVTPQTWTAAIAQRVDLDRTPVAEYMQPVMTTLTVEEAADLATCRTRFRQAQADCLPVLDADGRVIRVLTVADCLANIPLGSALENYNRLIFERAAVGISLVDAQTGRFLDVNPALCSILGYSAAELMNLSYEEVTHPDDVRQYTVEFRQFLLNQVDNCAIEKRVVCKDGRVLHTRLTISLVRTETGDPDYFVSVIEDITAQKIADQQLRDSLHEKEVLLQEINHRVKNNLQVITSLLDLQSRRTADGSARSALEMTRDRISSMLLVHEQLHRSPNLQQVDFASYARTLAENLIYTYMLNPERIELELNVSAMLQLNQAVACGLILNELVTNAIKHGLRSHATGHLQISLLPVPTDASPEQEFLGLVVANDGTPLPENFDRDRSSSMGLRLVTLLAQELKGTVEVERSPRTQFRIVFPHQ